jgi:hypothetical protein
VSPDIPAAKPLGGSDPLVIEAVFHLADDAQAQTIASRMIETAHQIANLPECECDVDVSVSRSPAGVAAADTTGAPSRGRPSDR